MKITNKANLPTAFVKMAESDYTASENEYRVTQLLKGIKETVLEKRHDNEIERDCSEMIWLLFGTATHAIMEKQEAEADELKETRVKINVSDSVLSGQFDLYSESKKEVTDYKTCSVWKVIYGDTTDWRNQLLMYAYMMRQQGFEVERGQVMAIMKDHSASKAKFDPSYPQTPVVSIKFKFTDRDFAFIEDFIQKRIEALQEASELPDNSIPPCTPEERYNDGDKYAVMKKNRKTALRVLDSKEEAESWIADRGGDYIELRPGTDKKCNDYCAVKDFCNHYKEKNNG